MIYDPTGRVAGPSKGLRRSSSCLVPCSTYHRKKCKVQGGAVQILDVLFAYAGVYRLLLEFVLQIGVYKRPFFSWGSLLRSNKDQKGSVPLAPQILLGVDECNLRSIPVFEAQGSHVEVDTSVGKAEDGPPQFLCTCEVKIVRSNLEKCNTFESSI